MKTARILFVMIVLLGALLVGMTPTAATAGADLVVSSISYDDAGHRISVVIRNDGADTTVASQPFYVDVFVDPPMAPTLGMYAILGLYTNAWKDVNGTIVTSVGPGKTAIAEISVALTVGAHKLYAIVDTDGYVTNDTNRANNIYGPKSIGGTGKPDLTVIFAQDPNDPDRVEAYIKNIGDAPVTSPFYVDIFVDPINPPVIGKWSTSYFTISGLPAGGETSHQTVHKSSLTKWLWIIVDTDNFIAEQNESNNIAHVDGTFQGTGNPDFHIKAISYDPGLQKFTVTIGNKGTGAGKPNVDIFVVPPDAAPTSVSDTSQTSAPAPTVVEPGGTVKVVIDYPLATNDPATPYEVYAVVNAGSPIEETNPLDPSGDAYGDNVFGPVFVNVTQAPGPDVILTGLQYNASNGIAQVAVKNIGNLPVPNDFSVSLFALNPGAPTPPIGSPQSQMYAVLNTQDAPNGPGPLAIGETRNLKIQTQIPAGVARDLVAVADIVTPPAIVNEISRTNNFSNRLPIVSTGGGGAPDLETTVAYSAIEQKATVTITNRGTGHAGLFTVNMYVDSDPEPKQPQNVYELDAGASVNLYFYLVFTDMVTHTLKAEADVTTLFPFDSNLDNNVATIQTTGAFSGVDLKVTAITYSRANHAAYVKVQNVGTKFPVGANGYTVALWVDHNLVTPPMKGDTDYDAIAIGAPLGVNSETELTLQLPLNLSLGQHVLRAIANNGVLLDAKQVPIKVDEADDGTGNVNNTMDSSVNLQPCDGVDLAITGIYFMPPTIPLATGDYFIRVQNQGNVDITHYFYLDMFPDVSLPPVIGQWSSASQYVPGLPRYSSKDVKVVAPITNPNYSNPYWPGTHDIRAIVDTDRVIAESYEGNNIVGPVEVYVP